MSCRHVLCRFRVTCVRACARWCFWVERVQWAVRAWEKTSVRAPSRSLHSSQTSVNPSAQTYPPSVQYPQRLMRDRRRCWSPAAAARCWRRARWRSAATGCCSCGRRSAACWPRKDWCFTHPDTSTTTTPAARRRSCTSPTWRRWTAWSARASTCTSRWWCPRAERSTSDARRTRAGTRRSRCRWSSTRTARRSWPSSPAGRSSSSCSWSPRRRSSETRSRTPESGDIDGRYRAGCALRTSLFSVTLRTDALRALKDITAELTPGISAPWGCTGAGASCQSVCMNAVLLSNIQYKADLN